MISVPLISRKELEKRLAPYKCRCVAEVMESVEIWETGWGYPFTLWTQSGAYDFWQYQKVRRHRQDYAA